MTAQARIDHLGISTGAVSGGNLPTEVLRILHSEIATGRWPRGSRIPTWPELAAELRVGRSTIREAVSTLVHLGMLRPSRGRGTVVSARSAIPGVLANFTGHHSIEELLRVQRSLEVEACRLAAMRRSDADLAGLAQAREASALRDCRHPVSGRFHAAVFEIARTPLLTELYEGIEARLRAGGRPAPSQSGGPYVIDQQHRAIVAAIAAGDSDAAAASAAAHARAACQESRSGMTEPRAVGLGQP